ncbi:hypothetical protein RIF29_07831 [Crotalaria pallida]|uniref:Uncharacterized protein n=1 Tax=Crotalaria pallida TaxID=3830 RepID=A0AAN9J7C0_CROPI
MASSRKLLLSYLIPSPSSSSSSSTIPSSSIILSFSRLFSKHYSDEKEDKYDLGDVSRKGINELLEEADKKVAKEYMAQVVAAK